MTSEKATWRGQLFVNGPVFLILMGTMFGIMIAATLKILPWYFFPLSFLIAPALAWVYWSFAITKWRIWALNNVDDYLDLKQTAVLAGLIWPDGSIFERTEIRTAREKKIIFELEQRLRTKSEKRKFKDDSSIPEITRFKVSKASLFIQICFSLGCLGFGTYLLVKERQLIVGLLLVVIGVIASYIEFKKLLNNPTVLAVGNLGIETENGHFEWSKIQGEIVTLEGLGKSRRSYLVFWSSGIKVRVQLDVLDVTLSELRHVLKIYRGRYENF